MAQQEEGWPLGLQPLNVRVGLAPRNNNGDYSGSISFNTLVTGSPTCSTDSSSDLDTESTGSFFHDRSITLGSLIGVSNILELSKRSLRRKKPELTEKKPKNKSSKRSWTFFSLCSSDNDIETTTNGSKQQKHPPSLGHFLAVERRAANEGRRSNFTGPDNSFAADYEFSLPRPNTERNTLFVDGRIAPPRLSPKNGSDLGRGNNGEIGNGGGFGVNELFSCMCGKSSH